MTSLPVGPILRAMRHHKPAVLLMILEVAAGFAVSVHTYLLGSFYLRLAATPSGFDAQSVLVVTSDLETGRTDDPAWLAALAARDVERLRSLPGVQAAARVNEIPLNRTYGRLVTAGGAPERSGLAWFFGADAGAIEALGLRMCEGRSLLPADGEARDPRPVVISEALARQLFPEGGAVGARVQVRGSERRSVVVGVVCSVRALSASVPDPFSALFQVEPSAAERQLRYVVRVEPGARDAVSAGVPAALAESHAPRVTTARGIADGEETAARTTRSAHGIAMFMVGTILFVVLLGRLGMSSFVVSEQARAIGTRRALGARRRDIVAQLLLENVLATTLGLAVGLPVVALLALLARSAQREVAIQIDPAVVAVACLAFWAMGLAGALVPALRAARLPPTAATRAS